MQLNNQYHSDQHQHNTYVNILNKTKKLSGFFFKVFLLLTQMNSYSGGKSVNDFFYWQATLAKTYQSLLIKCKSKGYFSICCLTHCNANAETIIAHESTVMICLHVCVITLLGNYVGKSQFVTTCL